MLHCCLRDIVIYDDAAIRYSVRCIIPVRVCARARARTSDALKGLRPGGR